MAEELLKKFEAELNCSICLDTYTDPKQLNCHHVYCQLCLTKVWIQDQQLQPSLICPDCNGVTPVPANGVTGLRPAFRVNKLLEIVEEHKKATPVTENDQSASTSPTQHENINVVCPEHGGRDVDLYCETCEETICWECIMKGSKHHSHEYKKLNDAFEKYKQEILSSLEPLEKQLATIEKLQNEFDECQDKITSQQESIAIDINNTIKVLHETLEVRRTGLISQLDQLTQAKLKSLAVQKNQIETTKAQLSSCLLFLKANLNTGNHGEALMMKSTTVRQVKELTTTFQPDMLEPDTEADLIFSALADLRAECQKYGIVYAKGSPYPFKCFVKGTGVDRAEVGEISTAILQTLNFDGQPCKESTTFISCELVSDSKDVTSRGSVERSGEENKYKISYKPTIKGRHQLHIKVEGQHIKGSPFPVSARSPVEGLSPSIMTINEVTGTIGVTVNKRGEVVVSECDGHQVSVFSPSGERLRSFGAYGSETGEFKNPADVAVDDQDNILVVDSNNSRIQKFTAQGKFLKAVGTEDDGPLQFNHPKGIGFNATNGRVYVVDTGNNRIQIFNNCDFDHIHGTFSLGAYTDEPRYLAFDSTGNVYMADYENHHIQVFTAEGEFMRKFGKHGKGEGQLNRPYGIGIDSRDRVYVSEFDNCRVSVFTTEGEFLTAFGSEGKEKGQFSHPQGLAVDSSGVVYVCEQECSRVQLF